MKKILLISSIFLGGILFAQNANFKQNFSTSELEKIQKTLPENQKPELYRQYFRAKIFEDMKRDFNYKKYSDILLKKFADTIISTHNWGADEKFEPEKFISFEDLFFIY